MGDKPCGTESVSVATRQVAGNTVAGDNQVKGIPLKLGTSACPVFKASPSGKMTARIRINRGNLPAIKLGTARVRLARVVENCSTVEVC
ncbi:Minor tail protein Z (GPZ) of prophage [Escherichia coli]|nr:Minor tail protein Z (GPZ) of prophage [Escherichia coli]